MIMLLAGLEMNEFMEYIDKITPWFQRDGVGTDDETFYDETIEHQKALHALGEKIHARFGIDGLFAAHAYADNIRFFGRFVEHAFNNIGEWRS